ncbi:urease accessory protein [Salegentibacter echinorum]|uniref:Urease accessory protein UreE n=1 Tax=Salegentibacter echinorum TaxID=1073325 RepID=A0A1M5K3V7_SALEC|nr:urease accessory protein UreE [Salegentibacter echinorum]SHG47456.1 urease accessory protein [Salegentibacter echinorum]
MIIEKIVGNLIDMDASEIEKRHIEKVRIDSDDLVKRIQRLTTDHDREIGVRLKDPKDLLDGDILFMDDKNMIVIDVLSDDVIAIQPKDIHQMGVIAHQLGNRHLPAKFEGNEMLVQYDYLVEDLLKKQDISFKRKNRKVREAFRHIGHSH